MLETKYKLIEFFDQLNKFGGFLKIVAVISTILTPIYYGFFKKDLINDYNSQRNISNDD